MQQAVGRGARLWRSDALNLKVLDNINAPTVEKKRQTASKPFDNMCPHLWRVMADRLQETLLKPIVKSPAVTWL